MTTASTRRRLDRLARLAARRLTVCAQTAGGQCHTDPEHVMQVLEELAQIGALEEVLERAGLTAGMVDP